MARIVSVRVFRMKNVTSPIAQFLDAAQEAGSGVAGLLSPLDIVVRADTALNADGTVVDFARKTKIEFEDIGLMSGVQFREFALKLKPLGTETHTWGCGTDLAVYGIAIYAANTNVPDSTDRSSAASAWQTSPQGGKGCAAVSHINASADVTILGMKTLPTDPSLLRTHALHILKLGEELTPGASTLTPKAKDLYNSLMCPVDKRGAPVVVLWLEYLKESDSHPKICKALEAALGNLAFLLGFEKRLHGSPIPANLPIIFDDIGQDLLVYANKLLQESQSPDEAITASYKPPKLCPNCGEKIRDTAVICTMCGLNLRTGEILRSGLAPPKQRKHRSRLGMVVLYPMFFCLFVWWFEFFVGLSAMRTPSADLVAFALVNYGLNLAGILICKVGSHTSNWDKLASTTSPFAPFFWLFPGVWLPYIWAVIVLELFGNLWIIAVVLIVFSNWGIAFVATKLDSIDPKDLSPKVPAKQVDVEQPTNARTGESGATSTREPVPSEPNRTPAPASNNGDQPKFNSASPGQASRTWTDRQGLEVDATYIGLIRDTRVVRLRRSRDQRVFEIPIQRLSYADQEYVRAHTEPDAMHTKE